MVVEAGVPTVVVEVLPSREDSVCETSFNELKDTDRGGDGNDELSGKSR